jgi:predicted KAP-like P-loop ATPase
MDNLNKEDIIKYPRFIEDRPEGRDDYESKSQIKIANNIIQFLNENEHSRRRVIGIEGEWGSGKSNVIEILKKQLLEKYYFYIFDAWGHQEDLTRRSILEGLLVKLIKDEQLVGDKKKWLKELSTLRT